MGPFGRPDGGTFAPAAAGPTRDHPEDMATVASPTLPHALPRPRPPTRALPLLGLIRWLLPLVLAIVAFTFEWTEHVALEQEPLSFGFWGEIVLFALGGPLVVYLVLGWVRRLVVAYESTSNALADVNRDLEGIVVERTADLRATGEELAARNAELAHANEDLRQVDRLKSEFVSLVSHQLRAPLTNISGALELITADAAVLPASDQRSLSILSQESQRLSHLIQTILDVSRLETGRLTVRLGPVALEPILARAVAAAFQAQAERPRILDLPPGLPPAWGDEMLIEEVTRNLLDNALRYSPPGSAISITAAASDGRLEVSVADHGPGIAPAERENIFRSFYRVGDPEATPGGYGLGLYFADKLIRAQGGDIRVESPAWPNADAPGARFVFSLPVAAEAPDESDETLEPS